MHDQSVCQPGVYDRALKALKLAQEKGFRVTINCTLFNNADPARVASFFDSIAALGIEGITVSPVTPMSARRISSTSSIAKNQDAVP